MAIFIFSNCPEFDHHVPPKSLVLHNREPTNKKAVPKRSSTDLMGTALFISYSNTLKISLASLRI
ncbi:hypothetical protein EV213_11312 [Aureibacillus halotolerans]|uniref:Uncharacterized protein n=1 Tax=Aureibacillus halotolerans TaxID=1508390 RepID=A0A4R6TUG6_9BACI|nr:hypothetical protein EV213_11312 [Aureibacillus halotolerans]